MPFWEPTEVLLHTEYGIQTAFTLHWDYVRCKPFVLKVRVLFNIQATTGTVAAIKKEL